MLMVFVIIYVSLNMPFMYYILFNVCNIAIAQWTSYCKCADLKMFYNLCDVQCVS